MPQTGEIIEHPTKEKRAERARLQELMLRETALREKAELSLVYEQLLAPDLRGAVCMHGGMI